MLPRLQDARQPSVKESTSVDASIADIGVGIDTSRYGHYAAFLNSDLQQAAGELEVVESAAGYAKLRDRFHFLLHQHGRVQFHVRVDVAGAYADKPAIAIGHVMRKLLHLAFAVWKTNKPFDPNHYPWHAPSHLDNECKDGDESMNQAAGLEIGAEPIEQEVTAACDATVADGPARVDGANVWLDFAHIKKQMPLSRLLDHLGLTPRLKGSGPQRRCACPIHRGDGRGRTFSVNLAENLFQCFETRCAAKGDVIDLWAKLNGRSVREAALELVQTFHLEPAPRPSSPHRPGHG